MADTQPKPVLCATPVRIQKYLHKLCEARGVQLAEHDLEAAVAQKLCEHIDGTRTAKDIVLAHIAQALEAVRQERMQYLSSLNVGSIVPRGSGNPTELVSLEDSVKSLNLGGMPDWAQKSLAKCLMSKEFEDAWDTAADDYWDAQLGEALDVAVRIDEASRACTGG